MQDFAYVSGKGATIQKNPDADTIMRHLAQRLTQKRIAAKAYLGKNWIGHADYLFRERHSNSSILWFPKRTLRQVEEAAREAGKLG